MDIELSRCINGVRFAVASAIVNSFSKRLTVLQDGCPCKLGCFSCCYRMIYVSVAEALIVYDYLKTHKIWDETKRRCINLIELTKKSSPLSWFKMRIECPVLDPDTKMCGAYEVRPPPCSTHFVTSKSEACDPWSLKPIKYRPAGMADIYEKYEKDITNSLDGHGILSYRLPIVIALLFAEKINSKTKMKADEITSFIYNELK